jgi:uncharacterized protein (TIGR02757 family)
MMPEHLKAFLDKKAEQYNCPAFIKDDPVSIPHLFTSKQDIEIAGFFAAVFAWGNRKTIIGKCRDLMRRMDNAPWDFIKNHSEKDLKRLKDFKHRTFNEDDLYYFIHFLHHHYIKHTSLEKAFIAPPGKERVVRSEVESALIHFKDYFFSFEHLKRTEKHISSPEQGSACKRLNIFLRWMVRKDDKGVDFGLWKKFSPSALICPVDVHVARVARKIGLLKRKQVDWLAAMELTAALRKLDSNDPVKYDFALFNLGVIEMF